MARVEILETLKKEILKKFKKESITIFKLMKSLESQPKKGKLITSIGAISLKEIKYKSFRFYFLVDSYKIRFLSLENLENLLIRFVKMSDKKNQQKIINEIKNSLRIIKSLDD